MLYISASWHNNWRLPAYELIEGSLEEASCTQTIEGLTSTGIEPLYNYGGDGPLTPHHLGTSGRRLP